MRRWLTPLSVAALVVLLMPATGAAQQYEIFAIRYGRVDGFPLRALLPDAPAEDTIDIAMAFWVIRDEDRVVLFDTGFFREVWFDRFDIRGFVRPDRALSRIGLGPADVTDVVVSHAHWDHMGGVELFPNAVVWIQAEEFAYYTGAAWKPGGNHGGIDPADVSHIVDRNTAGLVRLVEGDGVEILPGITVFTGARHTYASQYVMVEGSPRFVLASDNAYLFRNLNEGLAGATFSPEDRDANLASVQRMLEIAGDPRRVIPGHDADVFQRFPRVGEDAVRITPETR